MKQLLLATSALVAFAGAAAAEVTVTGDARIGLRYDDGLACSTCADGTRSGWNTVSRARAIFTMTGETDSGLSFGANFRADQASRAVGGNGGSSSGTRGTVWISGTYGKLSAGDIDSGLESAVGDLPEIGVSSLNYYNEMQYTGSDLDTEVYDEAGLLYEYKFGDASIYASFMDQYVGYSGEKRLTGNSWSLGAGYNLGNYTFGIGYEKAGIFVDPVSYTYLNESLSDDATVGVNVFDNDNRTWGISGGTSVAGITFKAIYLSTKVDGSNSIGSISSDDYDFRQYGIGAEYKMANGVQLAGYWRKLDGDSVLLANGLRSDNDANIYGIGAGYDLGGGAVVKGGIAHIEGTSAFLGGGRDIDRTIADFGLQLKF
ncbi:porin [Paracoccus suum]|nr:porin [Paracoccus suum]